MRVATVHVKAWRPECHYGRGHGPMLWNGRYWICPEVTCKIVKSQRTVLAHCFTILRAGEIPLEFERNSFTNLALLGDHVSVRSH